MSKYLTIALAVIAAAVVWMHTGLAADYPDRPIKLIVPFPPGGTTDVLGRIFAQSLSEKLGSPIVVENKAGASSAIGIDAVAKAVPDGYTLLWGPSDGLAVLPAVRSDLPYQPEMDFTALGLVAYAPFVFAVSSKLPVQNLKGLIAYANDKPDALNYGTPGVGSAGHLATALLEIRTGIKLTHVPYKGGLQAINDLLAGQIQMTTASPTALLPFVQTGAIRLLAQTGKTRISLIADVPTMAEAGVPDFVVESWFGVLGPKGLPASVTAKLAAAIVVAQSSQEVRKQFAAVGVRLANSKSLDFKSFISDNVKLWSDVAARSNIHVNN